MRPRPPRFIDVLALETGLSPRTVRRSIAELERLGIITWDRVTDTFQIHIEVLEAMPKVGEE
jgi:DNA-binding IclR family transcriptional regulator